MKYLRQLSDSFLFRNLSENELSNLLDGNEPSLGVYKKGELIYSSASHKRLVGFVLSGGCEVRRERTEGGPVLLNMLSVGDSFGILSVFSEEEFPTRVFAAKSSEILFFTDAQILKFLAASPRVSENVIRFMAGRISFLNKRIATFSGNRVEDRLSAYLLCERDKYSKDSFPFSYVRCSEEINAGRASVYRAVASLEGDGLIGISNKTVYIIDRGGLERIINV